ncbi:MAG: SDR family NAD(P)-dependent oxidoreductase [Fimbriimonas sp.]
MEGLGVLAGFRLDGKVALVTGGSKGLGKVMATALAAAGADVAICSRNLAEGQSTAHDVAEATGKRIEAFAADVTSSAAVANLQKEVLAAFGQVDILINNAGNNVRGLVHELTEADFDSVIDTNLKSAFLCAQAFGPAMAERKWGRILNLSSILGSVALPGRVPYCAAKAGITAMTKVLALEWATQGVTVNALAPGPFATEMNLSILNDPEKYRAFIARIPMGRWGELEEIAGPALLLVSPAGAFITGTTLLVDGGWTAQ